MSEPLVDPLCAQRLSIASEPSTVRTTVPPSARCTEVDEFLEASSLSQYKYVLRAEGYEDLADLIGLIHNDSDLFCFLIPRPGHRAKLQRLLPLPKRPLSNVSSVATISAAPFPPLPPSDGAEESEARVECLRPALSPSPALKVVVVGPPACGKTSLIRRLVRGDFSLTTRPTIGAEFSEKRVLVGGKTLRLHFWDVWGQEHSAAATRSYYHQSRGAMIVYDAADRVSLERAAGWKADMDAKVTFGNTSLPIPVILVGSKFDCCGHALVGANAKHRSAQDAEKCAEGKPNAHTALKTAQEVQDFCNLYGFVAHFFTSALTGMGVEEAVLFLLEAILKMDPLDISPPDLHRVRLLAAPEERQRDGTREANKKTSRNNCGDCSV